MAVGAETALLAHRSAVGREVDIIGFDKITLSGYVPGPLNTVAQDRIALGRESVNLLIDIIRKTSDERNIIVAHKLSIRQSA